MTSRERLIAKLQKLRALATDPAGNPHEVAAAAARMTEIMLQAGISEEELAHEVPQAIVLHLVTRRTMPLWKRYLVDGICRVAGVTPLRRSHEGKTDCVLVGAELSCAGVAYQYEALGKDILDLQRRNHGARAGTREHTDFCLGVVAIVVQRLDGARKRLKAEITDSRALARLDYRPSDAEVAAAIGTQVKAGRAVRTRNVGEDFRQGYRAGQRLNLAPGPALKAEKEALR